MEIKHHYLVEGEHDESDKENLEKKHGYKFTEEHLEFIKSFPGLCFEGSKIVKIEKENSLGNPLIHQFFSASDILFVLSDESIMEAFEDIPNKEIGHYSILTFSLTETEIFLVGSEKSNKNDIFVYSTITDETINICNGIENFINNFLR